MGNFADEIGRWHYTVETDEECTNYTSGGIYTEDGKERVRRDLLALEGVYSDTLRWEPGPASKR